MVFQTVFVKHLGVNVEAILIYKLSCQLIRLEKVHQGEGVGIVGDLPAGRVLLLHDPAQELLRLTLAILEFYRFNQHC